MERGPRKEMIKKERDLVETNPGPENREPWAGKRKPPQTFSLVIRVDEDGWYWEKEGCDRMRRRKKAATWMGDLENGIADPRLDTIAWYHGNAQGTTHPVAKKQANPWGLYDMLGNVYEWCADRYALYGTTANQDSRDPDLGAIRVVRGGRWDGRASDVRAARRFALHPSYRIDDVGFRLARQGKTREP